MSERSPDVANRGAMLTPGRVRAVVQPVTRASVTVDDEVVGSIGDGLLLLLGVTHDDGPAQVAAMVRKLNGLRILPGELRCADTGAALLVLVLVLSEFTRYGDTRKRRRPSCAAAARERSRSRWSIAAQELRSRGAVVETDRFGAGRQVSLVNDPPFTCCWRSERPQPDLSRCSSSASCGWARCPPRATVPVRPRRGTTATGRLPSVARRRPPPAPAARGPCRAAARPAARRLEGAALVEVDQTDAAPPPVDLASEADYGAEQTGAEAGALVRGVGGVQCGDDVRQAVRTGARRRP